MKEYKMIEVLYKEDDRKDEVPEILGAECIIASVCKGLPCLLYFKHNPKEKYKKWMTSRVTEIIEDESKMVIKAVNADYKLLFLRNSN